MLDDPAAYAAELRAAAGLPEQRRRGLPRPQLPTPQRVEATIDRLALRGCRRVGDTAPWEVVEAMRPAWWVARAWVAVTLLDQATGAVGAREPRCRPSGSRSSARPSWPSRSWAAC